MSDLELYVVIVNYNVAALLRRCLKSVLASEGVCFQVCVVDNQSTDGSAEMVASEFPQVQLIKSDINGGFAYANNLALRDLIEEPVIVDAALVGVRGNGSESASSTVISSSSKLPRFVLLLNPDTEVPPDAFRCMIDFLEARPEAGVAGPKLVLSDGSLDLACRRSFPSPEVSLYRMLGLSRRFPTSKRFGRYNLTYLDPNEEAEVDSVVGAFMLIRREAIEQVGLLDESFFMYGEDLDWAFRMKEKGWKVYYNPGVIVLHLKGQSSRQLTGKALKEFYRAMEIFYNKHYAKTNPFFVRWLIRSAIYSFQSIAVLKNALRPASQKRVS